MFPRAEADSNRSPSAYQPNALPLGQTGSLFKLCGIAYRVTFYTEGWSKATFLGHRDLYSLGRHGV